MKGSFYQSTEFKRRLEKFQSLSSNSRGPEKDPLDEDSDTDAFLEDIDKVSSAEEDLDTEANGILEELDNDVKDENNNDSDEETTWNNGYKYEIDSYEETDVKKDDYKSVSSKSSTSFVSSSYDTGASNKAFICEYCQKGYGAKASLDRHKKKIHGIDLPRENNKTSESSKVYNIKDYIIGNDPPPPPNDAKAKADPQTDRYIVSDSGRFFCRKCDKSTKYRTDINKHFRKVHLGLKSPAEVEREAMQKLIEYDCPKCDASGFNEIELKRHHNEVHGSIAKANRQAVKKARGIQRKAKDRIAVPIKNINDFIIGDH